jgi:integrase
VLEVEGVQRAEQHLRLANDRQLLPSMPKVRVLTENTRQGVFERPDLEAVVAALPDYLRDFTRFAYLTGWRKGEIISLRWTDVDRDAGAIRLRPEAAKTGRGRTVMIEGDLAELIAVIDRRWEKPAVREGWQCPSRHAGISPRRSARGRLTQGLDHRVRVLWGSPTSSSTTCDAPRPATWCAPVFRSASRWRSPGT